MRFCRLLVFASLTLGLLGACHSIHNPNVRPAAYLPAGPVTDSSEPVDVLCPADMSHASEHGGRCPTAKEARKAEKDRVARKIFDIHAHGG